MEKLERLAYWKALAVAAVRAAGRSDAAQLEAMEWKDEDDLFAFFDCFRPDGTGVETVFAGVVGGDEIVQRLRRVYEATRGTSNAWGYFIVRRPARATPERLLDLAAQRLDKVKQIARSFRPEWKETKQIHDSVIAGAAELARLLDTPPQIEIKREAAPARAKARL